MITSVRVAAAPKQPHAVQLDGLQDRRLSLQQELDRIDARLQQERDIVTAATRRESRTSLLAGAGTGVCVLGVVGVKAAPHMAHAALVQNLGLGTTMVGIALVGTAIVGAILGLHAKQKSEKHQDSLQVERQDIQRQIGLAGGQIDALQSGDVAKFAGAAGFDSQSSPLTDYQNLRQLVTSHGQSGSVKVPIMVEKDGNDDFKFIDVGSNLDRIRVVTRRPDTTTARLDEYYAEPAALRHDAYDFTGWLSNVRSREYIDATGSCSPKEITRAMPVFPRHPLTKYLVPTALAALALPALPGAMFGFGGAFGLLGVLSVGSAILLKKHGASAATAISGGIFLSSLPFVSATIAALSHNIGGTVGGYAAAGVLTAMTAVGASVLRHRIQVDDTWSPFRTMAKEPDKALETAQRVADAEQQVCQKTLHRVWDQVEQQSGSLTDLAAKLESGITYHRALGAKPSAAVAKAYVDLVKPASAGSNAIVEQGAQQLRIGGILIPKKQINPATA